MDAHLPRVRATSAIWAFGIIVFIGIISSLSIRCLEPRIINIMNHSPDSFGTQDVPLKTPLALHTFLQVPQQDGARQNPLASRSATCPAPTWLGRRTDNAFPVPTYLVRPSPIPRTVGLQLFHRLVLVLPRDCQHLCILSLPSHEVSTVLESI